MWWAVVGLAWAGTFEQHDAGRFYKALSSEEPVVRRAARAVVWFDRGSGFVVSPQGHVLTSFHVAELEGDSTSVLLPSGRWMDLEMAGSNEELDVALYRRTEPIPTSSWIALRGAPVRRGEEVAVIGNPAGLPTQVSFGEVVDARLRAASAKLPPAIGYSAAAWWGSSGSPVTLAPR